MAKEFPAVDRRSRMELAEELRVWKAEVLSLGVRLGVSTAEAKRLKAALERETKARKHHEERRRQVLTSLKATETKLEAVQQDRDFLQRDRDKWLQEVVDAQAEPGYNVPKSSTTHARNERDEALAEAKACRLSLRKAKNDAINHDQDMAKAVMLKNGASDTRNQALADRNRAVNERDEAVSQQEDTHKDLLASESQATLFQEQRDRAIVTCDSLRRAHDQLREQRDDAVREYSELMQSGSETVDQLRMEARSDQGHIRDAKASIGQLRDEAERKNACIRELRCQIEARDRGCKEHIEQLNTQVEALQEENARLDHASVRYFMGQQTEKVNEAQAEVARVRSRLGVVRAEREQANKANREYWDTIRASDRTYHEMSEKLGTLEGKLRVSIREGKITSSRLRTSGQEVMRLRALTPNVYTILKTDLKMAQDKLEEMKRILTTTQLTRDSLRDRLQIVDKHNNRLSIENTDAQELADQAIGELETARAKIIVLGKRIGRLTSGGARVVVEGKAYAASDGDTIELRGVLAQRNEETTNLKEELETTKDSIAVLKISLSNEKNMAIHRGQRIDSLRGHLREWKDTSRKVKGAFNALHLESGATTEHPPLRPTFPVETRPDYFSIGWTCVRCGKAFISTREAHDMDKHAQDCIWVELSEVRAGTWQDVAAAFK